MDYKFETSTQGKLTLQNKVKVPARMVKSKIEAFLKRLCNFLFSF